MARYFISRHPGALEWFQRQGLDAQHITHLDPALVGPGDVVMGTLPVHLAAEVCGRGARYLHLQMAVSPDMRGTEFSADLMELFDARLVEISCAIR